jgi:hypothetical protein
VIAPFWLMGDEGSFRYAGWRVALAAAGCVFVGFASLLVYNH